MNSKRRGCALKDGRCVFAKPGDPDDPRCTYNESSERPRCKRRTEEELMQAYKDGAKTKVTPSGRRMPIFTNTTFSHRVSTPASIASVPEPANSIKPEGEMPRITPTLESGRLRVAGESDDDPVNMVEMDETQVPPITMTTRRNPLNMTRMS